MYTRMLHLRNTTLAVVLAVVFLPAASVCASEEAVTLLMNAYRHSGANPSRIRTGAARFSIQVEYRPDAEANAPILKGLREQQAEKIKEIFKHNPQQIEAELKRLEEDSKRQAPEVIKRQIVRSFLMQGNDFYFAPDGRLTKRRVESTESISISFQGAMPDGGAAPKSDMMHTISVFMGSLNQPGTCLYVRWIPNSQRVEYTNMLKEVEEFQLFGRLQELGGSWIHNIFGNKLNRTDFSFPSDSLPYFLDEIEKNGMTCEITGEESYDKTEKATVVEVKKNGILIEKYHIDASRGFICPYLFAQDEKGRFSEECIAKDFFKVSEINISGIKTSVSGESDFYYPSQFINVSKDLRGESRRIYKLISDSLVLNQAVSETAFAIDVPKGGKIYRSMFEEPGAVSSSQPIQVQEWTYHATAPGTISLKPGGYDLDQMQWLEKEIPLADYVPPAGGAVGWTRFLLMAIGAAMVIIAIFLKVYQRRKRS